MSKTILITGASTGFGRDTSCKNNRSDLFHILEICTG
jgi:NADP-dependent 3-hydroxy acid dehydrogenase YdfG